MPTFEGIDVSHWQGNIDWAKVKASGVQFAIIKAGGSDAGFYTDSKWERNYRGAKANGIAVGAYYFVGPKCTSADAGKADAQRFLKLLKGKQLEYPVFMDNEVQPASSRAGTTQATIAFCRTLENAGYYAGVYGSAYSGFRDRMIQSSPLSRTGWLSTLPDVLTMDRTASGSTRLPAGYPASAAKWIWIFPMWIIRSL